MQMIKPLVSVIIPFYNDQLYIVHCVKSVMMQTYKNLEIILIDDGSTDSSYLLCRQLATSDHRIRLIHQQNKGVSSARNTGLENVNGEYIIFADADDYFCSTSIQEMLAAVSNHSSDFVIFEYKECESYCATESKSSSTGLIQKLTADEAFRKIINPYGFYGSVWAKLFKTEIINRYNLRFDEHISVGEDLMFVINYMTKIRNYLYSSSIVYNYYNNQQSVLRSDKITNYRKRISILRVYELLLNKPELMPYRSRIAAIYTRELCDWYSVAAYMNYKKDQTVLKRKIRKILHIFLLDDTFKAKTKVNCCLKYVFPKISYTIIRKCSA